MKHEIYGTPMPNTWTTILSSMDLPHAGNIQMELRHDLQGQDYLAVMLEDNGKETTWLNVPVSHERMKAMLIGTIPVMSILGNSDHQILSVHRTNGSVINASLRALHAEQQDVMPEEDVMHLIPTWGTLEAVQEAWTERKLAMWNLNVQWRTQARQAMRAWLPKDPDDEPISYEDDYARMEIQQDDFR